MSRIEQLTLRWFRGAAEETIYSCRGNSVVIYGENGSGKSSFVDGIEVLISGRCEHLGHEYSGTYQEKGLINTHRPTGASTLVELQFADGSQAGARIDSPSKPKGSGAAKARVESWDYPRVILRQDEIAAFIKATKLEKYSALLPLLGLGHLEIAAENIRQISRGVAETGKLKIKQGQLTAAQASRAKAFGTKTDEEIVAVVRAAYARYVNKGETDPIKQRALAAAEIERQQTNFSKEERRYSTLKVLTDFDMDGELAALRAADAKLASLSEALVKERLAVVTAADDFAGKVEDERVACPACGVEVAINDLREHLAAEKERLKEIQEADTAQRLALANFCDAVLKLKSAWNSRDLDGWQDLEKNADLKSAAAALDDYDITGMRTACPSERVDEIATLVAQIQAAASRDSFEAPSSVQTLFEHARVLTAAGDCWTANGLAAEIDQLETLVAYLGEVEAEIRTEIRNQSTSVFNAISADIQRLWDQFHPDKRIQNVHLHVPFDADKAIDVAVQFHGVDQSSPRLTLSEGYRNSLGLSIFLALAMREAEDTPIILDDVVISMDRNHRGMLADILERECKGRQVILLTHERDWYIELTHLLPRPNWNFLMLLPWENPETGIRFQAYQTNFGLARTHLATRPDSAGNDARKIMDTELPIAAERLKVRLPYRRGAKNDQRTGVDFLGQMISDAEKAFQLRTPGSADYVANEAAVLQWQDTERRMIAWGNPASHNFEVRKPEAEKLIEACETALAALKCASCDKHVWFADTGGSEMMQCQCGAIRWRYGKT